MITNLQFAIKSLLLAGFIFGSTERSYIFMKDNIITANELSQLTLVSLCIVGILFLFIKDK